MCRLLPALIRSRCVKESNSAVLSRNDSTETAHRRPTSGFCLAFPVFARHLKISNFTKNPDFQLLSKYQMNWQCWASPKCLRQKPSGPFRQACTPHLPWSFLSLVLRPWVYLAHRCFIDAGCDLVQCPHPPPSMSTMFDSCPLPLLSHRGAAS